MEGNYYLVNFEGGPGTIMLTKCGTMVRCLQKAAVVGSICRWLEKTNEEEYILKGILLRS